MLEFRILLNYCNVDETAKYKLELNSTAKLIATMKIKLKCGMQAIHVDDLARYSRKLKAKSSEHKMNFYNCNGNYIIEFMNGSENV